MSGLNGSLFTALSGLMAHQGAMEATSNNVANANTPGYSRQVPVLMTSEPVVIDPLTFGTGVTLKRIDSVRDPILEARIQHETQAQGEYAALASAMQQTQVGFASSTGDIGTALSNFFNSVNQLSTNPADLSLRQGVLTAAGNLATAFNTAASNLVEQRSNIDLSVSQTVHEINQLSQQIAQLNVQIASLENVGQGAGAFVDQRTKAITQLADLVDVSVIPSGNMLTITTANGTALVAGEKSFDLSTSPGASGLQEVFGQGADITSTIISGKLGGLLQARDGEIPSIQSQLDSLAANLANSVNAVQTAGFDLNGNATTGVNFFAPPPLGNTGAALHFSLALSDPVLLAASSDGTVGSNGNVEALYALRNQAIVNGRAPSEYYSEIVFNVGNAASSSAAEQSASSLVLKQLNDQRGAISGVSLDEEAANMMRFQQAYAASAQVISTIASMMQTVINMKGY